MQINKNIVAKSFGKVFLYLGLFFLFTIAGMLIPKEAEAQSCTYSNDRSCVATSSGCSITTEIASVSCQQQGANSCPAGQSGNRCDHNGYIDTIYLCGWNGTYVCEIHRNNVGAGNCGCSGSPGGTTGGGTGGGPTNSCDCASCNGGCFQTDQSSSTIECITEPTCDDGDPDSLGYWCRPNCCGSQCGGNSCSCTPECTEPTGLTFTSPAANTPINAGTVLRWQIGNWGLDSNESQCSNNSCDFQSYSGQGRYKLRIGATNITDYCQGHIGSGENSYITTNQCTLTGVAPNWPGTTQTITVYASNNCGGITTARSFTFPSNEKPFCTGITATNTVVRNGLHGVRYDQPMTLRVTGGDTDGYGNPGYVSLCYAIRNQPNSFYLTPNGGAWECFGQANNSNTYSVNTTLQWMENNYTPTVPYSGTVTEHGFVVVSNVRDNITNNFCSTNIGHNGGAGAYLPGAGQTCNGGSCVIHIHNNAPEMTSATGVDGWIGTSPDSDNGLSCVDNNPAVYRMTVADPDGSGDLDRLDLAIAKATDIADANNDNVWDNPQNGRYWPTRILFGKKWTGLGNQEFANGTFFVRDTAITQNNPSTMWCLDQNQNLQAHDPTGWDTNNPQISRLARTRIPYTVWCYGYDSHSWDDVPVLSNQILNGVAVDVYYLRNDIQVYNDGFPIRLKANSAWQNSSYVAYERGGNRAFVQYVVEYLDDNGVDNWSGEYKNVWSVMDQFGKTDGTENLPGEYMATDPYRNSNHIIGDTKIDLTLPTITLDEPSPISASRLSTRWSTTDARSGIDRVYGEASSSGNPLVNNITNVNTGESYDLTGHPPATTPPPIEAPFLWNLDLDGNNQSAIETIDVGDNEQGAIIFEAYSQDYACNLNGTGNQINLSLPWVLTKGGNVHSDGSPNIDIKALNSSNYPNPDPISSEFTSYPFNINKWESGLSTELLSSGGAINRQHLPYRDLTGATSLQNYGDLNNKPWYTELRNITSAKISSNPEKYNHLQNISGVIGGNVSGLTDGTTSCADDTKVCVIEATSISIKDPANPLVCDRKTAIFVNGTLEINADINVNDEINGCIFVVNGNVNILEGSYKSGGPIISGARGPKYDLINAFIISDGIITVAEDPVETGSGFRDGLKVRGSLLAFGNGTPPIGSSLILERSLKLLDNLTYPAIVLHHDARYYNIAEETIGGDNDTYKKEIGAKP